MLTFLPCYQIPRRPIHDLQLVVMPERNQVFRMVLGFEVPRNISRPAHRPRDGNVFLELLPRCDDWSGLQQPVTRLLRAFQVVASGH